MHSKEMTASHSHPYGRPINVLKFGEENKVIIDNPELDKMFLHRDVKNRKVVVLSIIGAFRKGKSFFLDYCLRYLYATYPSIKNPSSISEEDWMGSDSEPLSGFTWRSGTLRDTTGIIMWSDVFLTTIPTTGEKIAIIVMDTQGLFDNETSPADNSRIFALGTLISSVQVLNLISIVHEDQLQYLQFATEFARFAALDSQGTAGTPFQNLLFLIRDWNYPDDYNFGMEGGESYLKNVLEIKNGQKAELKSVRQFIVKSFEELHCCLMPYPGKDVASSKHYDGQWKLMEKDFREELKSIVEKLLGPRKMVLKKINGKDLKGHELREYIQSYFTLFQSDTLPKAQSIYESCIEQQMSILIDKCLDHYKQLIVKNDDLLSENNLHIFYEMSASKTLMMFKDEKKMGNADHEKKYKAQLEAAMQKLYVDWRDRSVKSFQQLKEEKQKTEEAIKEKLALEQEALYAERQTSEALQALENEKKLKLIEDEKFEAQKEVMAQRLEFEKEQVKRIEAEREAEKAWRQVLEARLEKEQMANELENEKNKGWCSIM